MTTPTADQIELGDVVLISQVATQVPATIPAGWRIVAVLRGRVDASVGGTVTPDAIDRAEYGLPPREVDSATPDR